MNEKIQTVDIALKTVSGSHNLNRRAVRLLSESGTGKRCRDLLKLRDYQEKGIDQLRDAFARDFAGFVM